MARLSPSLYRWLAVFLWLLALAGATGGFFIGRHVYDRGVVYGPVLPVIQDLDAPRRAVNTQLELEPDAAAVRRSLRLIKSAGFGMIRQQFSWEAVEGGGKGQFFDTNRRISTWERFDSIIDLAREEGIEVLARIDLPPSWARPPGSYKTHPPQDVRDYGDFVEVFASRYQDKVRYIQLWNEPNLNEEWGRRPVDPAGFVELLRAGYRGAKRGNPHVRVVSPALAQTLEPDSPGSAGLNDLLYLDRLYAYGAKPYFDVLAVNAYGLWTGPEDRQVGPRYTNFPRVLLTREVMQRHDDLGKAVWVAEFGWNALPPNWKGQPSPWGFVAPERKSAHILGAYRRAGAEWPWMGSMALWLFRKPGADARDPTPFFALLGDDWSPRPAYEALESSADRQALGIGVHQESSAGLHFGGTWQWTPSSDASLGALRETPISGANLTWRFRGTNVDIIAPVGPSRGTAYVKINGAYTLANGLPLNPNGQATIDFYAPTAHAQRRIRIASGLPDRVHEVELTVTGEHAPASTGSGVGIDAITVWRARPLAPLMALAGGWGATGIALVWAMRERLLALAGFGGYGVNGIAYHNRPGYPQNGALSRRAVVPDGAAWLFAYLWNLPWSRLAILAVIACLPFAPLMIRTPAGTYSPVELASLLAMGVFALRLFLGSEQLVLSGAYIGPALLLVLGGIASTLAADYPRLALRELRTLVLEPAIFYVVARSTLHGRQDAARLALTLVAASTAAGVLAIVQSVFGAGLVAAEGVARATALYSSPNHLGLVLGKAIPLAVAGGTYLRGRLQRILGIAGIVCLIAIFLSFSRGAWLATAVALAVVLVPTMRGYAASHRRMIWLGSALAIPSLLAALLFAFRFERFYSLFSAAGTGLLRVHLWGSAWRMALDHPFLGVGLDQFLYHYPRYMHVDAWREPNLSHPHNLLLDFWLRLGLVGLIALVWASAVFLHSLMRTDQLSPAPERARVRWLRAGIAGTAVAFVLHGLVDNSYFLIDLAYIVWVMLLIAELAREAPARD